MTPLSVTSAAPPTDSCPTVPTLNLPNAQPAERVSYREDGSLEIVSLFRTIQGEGPLAGTPAIFLRLAGCNLTCPSCDTDYTSSRARLSVDELLEGIRAVVGCHAINLVVITGGEPFRQNVGPLTRTLLREGYAVQIETNGTLGMGNFPWGKVGISIVCSPKTNKINHHLIDYITAYKYVVRHGEVDGLDGLPTRHLGLDVRPARPTDWAEVFVQPLDEGDVARNVLNLQAAKESCLKYGYRLGLQMHKLIGVE